MHPSPKGTEPEADEEHSEREGRLAWVVLGGEHLHGNVMGIILDDVGFPPVQLLS